VSQTSVGALDVSRNWGFITALQQQKLKNAVVAIAGVGGVGGRIAVELTRMGVGRLVLADPDIFSPTNLNRQEGSATSTIDRNKSEVIAAFCRDINPQLVVDAYGDGVTTDNLERFLVGVDVLVEATDYTVPHLGVMLARAARQRGIPMVTGAEIGFGATVAWFDPAGYPYEKYLGLKPDVAMSELASGKHKIDIGRWIAHIPSYGDLHVLREVAAGHKEAPAISPAVGLCSAMATTQIVNLICGGPVMPAAPAVFSVDVKELRSRLIRHPYWHYRFSLLRLVLRSLLAR